MALIGLSLILASVVYVAIRRPPLIETLLSLWRGEPKIEQPPTTRSLPPPSRRTAGDDSTAAAAAAAPSVAVAASPPTIEIATHDHDDDRTSMPPPPLPVINSNSSRRTENDSAKVQVQVQVQETEEDSSPQTTPKASATHLTDSGVPTFTLSAEPPASAAAVARSRSSSTGASSQQPMFPSLTAPTISTGASPRPQNATPPSNLMPPPPPPPPPSLGPRPPTLNALPNSNSGSSLSVPGAARPSPLPQRTQQQHARQPGTSTLAPPPTHSSKPSKPSRKVTLEPGCSPLDWARLANSPTSDLRNLPPNTPYLRVPPSLLKAQNGRRGRDAWTAMGGRVYNVSPYLKFHPGGEAELLRGAGRDGTRLFGEVHPWVNYETMLASCLIGVLVAEGEEKTGSDAVGGGGGGEMDEMD